MRFTLIHLAHLMGEKLSGFRSAPSGIEFGPGLYARQHYAVGDVIAELSLDRKKLEGAMVGDGWSNCAVAGAAVATALVYPPLILTLLHLWLLSHVHFL